MRVSRSVMLAATFISGLGTLPSAAAAHLSASGQPGTMILAGGGSEGDIGDKTAWSYTLYTKLVQNGDINGDGQVNVAILSNSRQDNWLPTYFRWLGATRAYNVFVPTVAAANNPRIVDSVKNADIVFIKGGDQGEYYDLWKGTLLATHILAVAQAGGAIGGTSAGAMSMSQYCFCGSQDLVSLDVLEDAESIYLTDVSDGGSGIHTDYLGLVPNAVVDTHFTTRARLGRLLGILGKAVQDNNQPGILAIGIEERTGLWIQGNTAQVIGIGSVDFIHQTPATTLARAAGQPLYYTDLRDDRLTEGWRYDLAAQQVDTVNRPATAIALPGVGEGAPNSGALQISGALLPQVEHFAQTTTHYPNPYSDMPGTATPTVLDSVGILNAENTNTRGAIQETLWRALFDHPADSGFLVPLETLISRTDSTPDTMQFGKNPAQLQPEAAAIVIDGRSARYADLSPYVSNSDIGDGSLHTAALIGATVHVLADSAGHGSGYDTRRHQVVALAPARTSGKSASAQRRK